MTISTNAQRITRIYRGSNKVFQESGSNFYPLIYAQPAYRSGLVGIASDPSNPKQGYLIGAFRFTSELEWFQQFGTIQTDKKINGTASMTVPDGYGTVQLTITDNKVMAGQGISGLNVAFCYIEPGSAVTIS